MESRRICAKDAQSLEPGYYWIRRNEPDGPPAWEVARLFAPKDGAREWYVCGSSRPVYLPENVNASNAWLLGPRIERPA